jgi:HEPN domain-containing protein
LAYEEAKILQRRSESFLKNANYLIGIEDWDLAIFNLEQSCQLALKHKILLRTGSYPRTHSIRELLTKISEFDTSVNVLLENETNFLYVTKLEDAYIVSRYIPKLYSKQEALALQKFVQGVFKPIVDRIRVP